MGSSGQHKFKVFNALCTSLAYGIVRVYEARAVTNTVTIAVLKVNMFNPPRDRETAKYIEDCGLTRVSPAEYDGFRYVSNASYLVYITALFDTFLSDVTKFLIYCNPSSIKDAFSADFDDICGSQSIYELKNRIIARKVKHLSFQGFGERIKLLKRMFGLKIIIDPDDLRTLGDISSIRNALAHDQAFLDLRFSEAGELSTYQKSCPRHPTLVTDELFAEAWRVYMTVCKKLYLSVVEQVIKYKDDSAVESLVSVLNEKMFIKKKEQGIPD